MVYKAKARHKGVNEDGSKQEKNQGARPSQASLGALGAGGYYSIQGWKLGGPSFRSHGVKSVLLEAI
jgi:hypothetical protein